MENLSLFAGFEEPPASPLAAKLAPRLEALRQQNIFVGTSSWKYEGWLNQIYTPERYFTRGRFSRKKFEEGCLDEYAETFPIVCGDFSFYQFPSDDYWRKLFGSAPAKLQFAFKVPEEITVKVYPSHARYGPRAGLENESFLNPEIFRDLFFEPLQPYAQRCAAFIFEFGSFPKQAFETPDHFLARLDPFLGALPKGGRYSVEIRNPEYLGPDYFTVLTAHNAAHVFNAWSRMPPVHRQIRMPGAFTADFTVVRALLRSGRMYEQAVEKFQPYRAIQDPNPETRTAIRDLIHRAKEMRQASYIFVNNRLEGNAPGTIEAITDD